MLRTTMDAGAVAQGGAPVTGNCDDPGSVIEATGVTADPRHNDFFRLSDS